MVFTQMLNRFRHTLFSLTKMKRQKQRCWQRNAWIVAMDAYWPQPGEQRRVRYGAGVIGTAGVSAATVVSSHSGFHAEWL